MSSDERTRPPKCPICGMFLTDDPAYAALRCVCKPGGSGTVEGDALAPRQPSDGRNIAPVERASF